MKTVSHAAWLGAAVVLIGLPAAQGEVEFGPAGFVLNGQPAPPASAAVCGFRLVANDQGPQIAITESPATLLMALARDERVELSIEARGLAGQVRVSADVRADGGQAEITLSAADASRREICTDEGRRIELSAESRDGRLVIRLAALCSTSAAAVRCSNLQLEAAGATYPISLAVAAEDHGSGPPRALPALHAALETALIEWDWRMQDGIQTARAPSSYAEAIDRTLARGDALLAHLVSQSILLESHAADWRRLKTERDRLAANAATSDETWEDLWRRVHQTRRRLALANPLAATGPLVFAKQAPSAFSHQLTQYDGRNARPGGGLFVLEHPGESMACRHLTNSFPLGSFEHPEVSFDGRKVLFAYCRVEKTPVNRELHGDKYFHLYEIGADGSTPRQLTDGPYDDFSPRYLPDGQIVFISTRRGGFHRCGQGPCPVHTLAVANGDGSGPRVISFHETHEWDPAVLQDGRVIYTRWDYVDRHAVHYQQLWSTRPDGSDVRIFYGNNTLNPVGVWEARPVPGSDRVMATAAAHHAMTAGSIILLDTRHGIDGLEPITRLTPDALFPESEAPVIRTTGGMWHAPVGVTQPLAVPPEAARWPGHCYRSPWPMSEDFFLAAYSFDSLIGEPTANPVNMFGIYLVDRFGNKELLYRDLNISSVWPTPLAPRQRPKSIPSVREATAEREGTFFLQNVYKAWPPLPKGAVTRLRIVQVLPKSTPHANNPTVGLANASPGKQVLGTVPVEEDGSACFTAPAGIPLAFQALDEMGRAVQVMRSVVYLQPGETASCVGCHEPRTETPRSSGMAMALAREPSKITPGPDGSRPLSYPILVQPVLDRQCVRCHSREKPEGKVVLSGEPEGRYTVSYNALAPRVSYSDWAGRPGDFRVVNSEPLSQPGYFGARGSRLMSLLLEGHYDVSLTPEDIERLVTWMDANALFYGTFDPAAQALQQRGERIAGPAIE